MLVYCDSMPTNPAWLAIAIAGSTRVERRSYRCVAGKNATRAAKEKYPGFICVRAADAVLQRTSFALLLTAHALRLRIVNERKRGERR
ncbi:hypothetical protein GLA29479_2906 [Lysobacter antibioticus]|jgi:hypothetical protein|uniref:hypothetical protein n=1 Tax=Lysobacter antibioticus TaxID=84531 RepID=UPI000722EF95|nr:hypothetical protein [Lysobacter antibioticus]ALN63769.1 hypothetical protein GLA29479_2906 [Lysobacter antibioticus]